MRALSADADGVGVGAGAQRTDFNIITSGSEIVASLIAEGGVGVTRSVVIQRDTAKKYEIDHLNAEQVQLYLNHLPTQIDNKDILTFALGTGMRISEVHRLGRSKVSNLGDRFDPQNPPMIEVCQQLLIDRKRWYVDVPKSEGSHRMLPIVNPLLWEILHRRLNDGRRLREPLPVENSERTADDLVFINAKGSFVQPDTIRQANERLLKRAGLPYINIHRLRHTFSTLCRERVEKWIVEKYLGHAEKGVSGDYNHAEQPLCKASAAMAEIMNGSPTGEAKRQPEEPAFLDLSGLSVTDLEAPICATEPEKKFNN